MTSRRTVLVTGATGKQGRALIHSLLHPAAAAAEPWEYHVLALTRDASSSPARRLLEAEGDCADRVALAEADLNDAKSVRRVFEEAGATGGVWGVFAVLAYPGLGKKADAEEQQGKMLADLALEFQVRVFVYSSTMPVSSQREDTHDASHLAKLAIEGYCQDLGAKGLNWAIIRPGFFMENLEDFLGSVAVSLLQQGLKKETAIALIASEDIGRVAAGAFRNHERFVHKIACCAAETVTIEQIADSYQRAMDAPMPAIPAFLGNVLFRINSGAQNVVKQLNQSHETRSKGGYPTFAAEVELVQSVCKMQTYYEWKSQRKTQERDSNWNKVSLFELLTGRS